MRAEAQAHQRALAEAQAIKVVAQQVNGTCQLLAMTLKGFLEGKLDVSRLDGRDGSLVIVWTEPGQELRDEVGDQLFKLLGLPVLVLPKSITLEAVGAERLAALLAKAAP